MGGLMVKNAGDPGLISGWGRFPGERNSCPLQYSYLENPTDIGVLGPCSDKRLETTYYIFLILEIKEALPTRKLLGGQKGSDVKSTHGPLRWNPSCLRNVHAHVGES